MPEQSKPRPISFTVSVTESDWDTEMGGWRLPVLRLPGVRVDGIYVEGHRADPGRFGVDSQQELLRWLPDPRPERARIAVTITEELTTQKESEFLIEGWRIKAERWKSLSAIFTAAAAIVAAMGTFLVQKGAEAHSLVQAQPLTAAVVSAPLPVAPPSVTGPTSTVSTAVPGTRPTLPKKPSKHETEAVNNLNIKQCSDGDPGAVVISVTFKNDGSAIASVDPDKHSKPSPTAAECVRKMVSQLHVPQGDVTGLTIHRTIRLDSSQPEENTKGGA